MTAVARNGSVVLDSQANAAPSWTSAAVTVPAGKLITVYVGQWSGTTSTPGVPVVSTPAMGTLTRIPGADRVFGLSSVNDTRLSLHVGVGTGATEAFTVASMTNSTTLSPVSVIAWDNADVSGGAAGAIRQAVVGNATAASFSATLAALRDAESMAVGYATDGYGPATPTTSGAVIDVNGTRGDLIIGIQHKVNTTVLSWNTGGADDGYGFMAFEIVSAPTGTAAVVKLGTATNTLSSTIAVSPSRDIQVGEKVCITLSERDWGISTLADNSSQAGTANSYTQQDAIQGGDPYVYIYTCVVTRKILSTDTITATFAGPNGGKSMCVYVLPNAIVPFTKDVGASRPSAGSGANYDSLASGTSTVADEYVIGVAAFAQGTTGPGTITANAPWTLQYAAAPQTGYGASHGTMITAAAQALQFAGSWGSGDGLTTALVRGFKATPLSSNTPISGTDANGTVTESASIRVSSTDSGSASELPSVAATKTYYVPTTADGNFGALVDGVAQTAASRADGWTVGTTATANSSEFDAATKQIASTFSTQSGTPKPASFLTGTTANAFKTPATLNGVFRATNWVFTFALRASVASSQTGRIRMRVFKSVNASGASATEITGATQVGTTSAVASTTVDSSTVVTWAPGAITLTNEYLFFVIAWETVAASGSSTGDWLIRTGSSAAGSALVTPGFTPTVNTPIGATDANSTATETGAIGLTTLDPTGPEVETATAQVQLTDLDPTGPETESATIVLSSADSGSTSESASISVPVSSSDTGTLAEVPTANAAHIDTDANGATNESAAIRVSSSDSGSDSESATISVPVSTTDANSTFTESAALALSSTDAGSIADTVTLVAPITVTDTNGATTEAVSKIGIQPLAADTGSDSETASTLVAPIISTDANSTTSESASVSTGTPVAASETVTGSDATLSLTAALSSSDTGGDSETASGLAAQVTTADATATASESASTIQSNAVSSTDSGTDSEAILRIGIQTLADAGSDSETASLVDLTTTTDSNGTTTESGSIVTAVAGTDSGTATETPTGKAVLTDTDAGSVAEVATPKAVVSASADTASISDVANASTANAKSDTDFNSATSESASVTRAVVSSDSGSDSESASAAVPLTSSDSATGTDSTTPPRTNISGSESATLSDTATAGALLTSLDSGTDLELSRISFGVSDNAVGLDFSQLAARLNDVDFGFGAEDQDRYPPTELYPEIPAGSILSMGRGEIVNASPRGIIIKQEGGRIVR